MSWLKTEEITDPKLLTVEYYTFKDPCYKCGQPIINGTRYPSTCTEESWDELTGTVDVGFKEVVPDIVEGYKIAHPEHITIAYPGIYKMFYHHWKCPTTTIEIPKNILERANKNVKEF
jgi:hypothetical protein